MAMETRPSRHRGSRPATPPGGSAEACHQAGVVVLTCGTFGNVIRLLPPLVIDSALLDDGLEVLGAALDQVLSATS